MDRTENDLARHKKPFDPKNSIQESDWDLTDTNAEMASEKAKASRSAKKPSARPKKPPLSPEATRKVSEGTPKADEVMEMNEDFVEEEEEPKAGAVETAGSEQGAEARGREGVSAQREVMDAWVAFDSAKKSFEQIGDKYSERYQTALEQINNPRLNFDEATKEYVLHDILNEDGLQMRHEAAVGAFYEAERNYVESYARWETELAKEHEVRRALESALKKFLTEKKEKLFFEHGEERQLAAVRQQIAGNELEQPIGTPGDLALLGFDKVFVNAYSEARKRFDKLEEEKLNAGFLKKFFGSGKLNREYEAARSDFASLQEEVVKRRMEHEHGLQEADRNSN